MSKRFYAGLGLGFALICVLAGIGQFATDKPMSAYGKHGWFSGLLILVFSERGARIASSTIYFALATFIWHFAWTEWKKAKPNKYVSDPSKQEVNK
ncbi:MAG: hypothetical protein HC782_01855 [Gammaproteobacteria bacterium]|nr:hypothetical protein [Gammaproteobacteria bacterium]